MCSVVEKTQVHALTRLTLQVRQDRRRTFHQRISTQEVKGPFEQLLAKNA